MSWNKRFALAIENSGKSKAELVEAIGAKSRSIMTAWTKTDGTGSETIDATKLLQMCDYMGVDFRWVITGEGAMFTDKSKYISPELIGTGPAYALSQDLGIKEPMLYKVINSEEFDHLLAGDLLVVDKKQTELENSAIYLLKDKESGTFFVRRYWHNFIKKTYDFVDDTARAGHGELDLDAFKKLLVDIEIVGKVVRKITQKI